MNPILQHSYHVIDNYQGNEPLANYLKAFFKLHSKLGSRDRKIISDIVYSYYRCAKSFNAAAIEKEEIIRISYGLCGKYQAWAQKFIPHYFEKEELSFEEKLKVLRDNNIDFNTNILFDADLTFSKGITKEQWLFSMYTQPLVFIRLMGNNKPQILNKLKAKGIVYNVVNEKCVSLAPSTKLGEILWESEYNIQDISSQSTSEYFDFSPNATVWDCCAGAGGKSLLIKELNPKIKLTVSDKRASVLENLLERFQVYQFDRPQYFELSLDKSPADTSELENRTFDYIVCDAPCSGSGTWARTPENFFFFETKKLKAFSNSQLIIASSALPFLKKGGIFIYITCSVFEIENELVVQQLMKQHNLSLKHQVLINGIEKRADSLFVAVLENNNI